MPGQVRAGFHNPANGFPGASSGADLVARTPSPMHSRARDGDVDESDHRWRPAFRAKERSRDDVQDARHASGACLWFQDIGESARGARALRITP
jgi:hypothetical protein